MVELWLVYNNQCQAIKASLSCLLPIQLVIHEMHMHQGASFATSNRVGTARWWDTQYWPSIWYHRGGVINRVSHKDEGHWHVVYRQAEITSTQTITVSRVASVVRSAAWNTNMLIKILSIWETGESDYNICTIFSVWHWRMHIVSWYAEDCIFCLRSSYCV